MPVPAWEAAGILQKLKWLTGLRLLLASILLGSAFVLDLGERLPFGTSPLYVLLACTFGLSLLYALGLRSQRSLGLQGLAQLTLDLTLVTMLVHYTGGPDSAFPFMFIFIIFAAANLLGMRGSVAVGILSSLVYATLVLTEWTRLIQPVAFAGGLPLRPAGYAVYQVVIHAVAFLAVAILSSHLAERLRQAGRELEQRGIDLRNLQTFHEAIVATIPSGIMTFDLAGRLISLNDAAERITGYRLAALQDQPWDATPFAPCGTLEAFFANPSAPLDSQATELELRRADGRTIPVGIACSSLRTAEGEVVGLVAIFQDLTERRKVEAQLRRADRLGALGQLAANIAHEVRNPLAAISGSVEVLREDEALAQSSRDLLEIILREARRLKLITGQFLDFVKPHPMLFRPCALRPLLEETLLLLAKSSEWQPGTRWELAEATPGLHGLADPDQLRQVTWNLCLNAIQSMPEGGSLTVTLREVSHEGGRALGDSSIGTLGRSVPHSAQSANPPIDQSPDPEWVEIALRDTGRGISAEALERIFDPFFTTRPSGTGLGLAIARKMVESMGGHIRAESHPGVGTVFRLWLRRAPAPANLPAASGDRSAVSGGG
jgi:two-component system sensor histidine kinase PilS (NtrC family)